MTKKSKKEKKSPEQAEGNKKDWAAVAGEESAPETPSDTAEQEPMKTLEHPEYEELESKLTEMEEKANEHWNQFLRAQAEVDNVRRRAERDVSHAHKFALEKFVQELLPVIDSLERGLEHKVDHDPGLQSMHEGMELTMNMFLKALEKFGVVQLNPVGEAFNPDHHEAISMQEGAKAESNTVLAVVQRGYLLNDRLVRPAMVVVSK